MPAYGKQMKPAEMKALIAFLTARRHADEPRDSDPVADNAVHDDPTAAH